MTGMVGFVRRMQVTIEIKTHERRAVLRHLQRNAAIRRGVLI